MRPSRNGVRPRRAHRRARGSVLIESAVCLNLLCILAFGTIEAGFAYRDRITEQSAVRGAARVISNAGPGPTADWQGILALRGELQKIGQAQVDRVVFFKADGSGNPLDATCLGIGVVAAHGVSGKCNVYSASEIFTATAGNFASSTNTSCSGTWDSKWCPYTRIVPTTSAVGDNIGVWLSIRYTSKTKLFNWFSMTMTDKYVMRVEPAVS